MRLLLSDNMTCITPRVISDSAGRSPDTVFIVPEPAKAQVERLVISDIIHTRNGEAAPAVIRDKMRTIPLSASFTGGDVVSFVRLSERILAAGGASVPSAGNDVVLRNAVYSVLASHHDEFRTFGILTGRAENITKLISLLGDFVRYNISAEEIGRALDAAGSDDSSAVYKDKLFDLKLMMEYLGELNSRYSLGLLSDPIAAAAKLLEGIDGASLKIRRYRQLRLILDHEFSIVQFGVTRNFTPGEYSFIEELDRVSRGVNIYLNSMPEDTPAGKCSSQVLSRLKHTDGCRIEKFVAKDMQTPELKQITDDYANGNIEASGASDLHDVVLSEIPGTDNVIGFVFDEIMRLTRDEGYRYRDIRIVCCDEDMNARIRPVASSFGLDVFIDRRIELSGTAVPCFVQLLLKLPLSGFALGDVLAVLRSGMIPVHPRYCDLFENYCVAKNITDASRMFNESWYLEEGSHPMKMAVESVASFGMTQEVIKAGKFLYKNIVERHLMPLRKAALEIYGKTEIASKAEAVLGYLDGIKNYIRALRNELMDSGRSDVAEATIRAYDETMSLLAAFTHEMNRVQISQRNFLELFRTDMMNKTAGTIPLRVDSVEITSPEHAFYTPCKAMFVIGARRDNFPFRKTVDGIMSPIELSQLSENISVDLPDKAQVKSREEFISSSLLLGAVTDRFYLVHSMEDNECRLFEVLKRKVSEDNYRVNGHQMPVTGRKITQRYSFKDASISPDVMKVLLDGGLNVSVTTLEGYMTCPIEMVLQTILKIRERTDNREVKANVFGTLAHKMFELAADEASKLYDTPDRLGEYADKLMSDPILLDHVSSDYVARAFKEERVSGTLDENDEVTVQSNNNQGTKLRRLFRIVFPAILKECAEVRFIPSEHELHVGSEPYLLTYEAGGNKFGFTGYVDRYDESYDDPKVFRIQDYKTYDKAFSPSMLLAGVQIQLPAYANAVMRGKPGSFPADFGYSLVKLKYEKGKPPYEFNTVNADLPRERMELVLRYTDYIIRKAIEDISSGKANALYNPLDKEHAKYHTLMGLCGNPPSRPVMQSDVASYKGDSAYDEMKRILSGEGEDNG